MKIHSIQPSLREERREMESESHGPPRVAQAMWRHENGESRTGWEEEEEKLFLPQISITPVIKAAVVDLTISQTVR